MAQTTTIRIGGFETIRRLQNPGGQGIVYEARCVEAHLDNVAVGDIVLLKNMPAHDDDGSVLRRLKQRTATLAAIRHPNIVRYYGCFANEKDDGTRHVVVMDYLHGQTLKELLDQNPRGLDADVALRIIRECLSALVHASEVHKLVHRDIKPGNIFICEDGTAKLIDFELARQEGGSVSIGGQGNLRGSIDYMAPDFTDKDFHGDEQSDIFSLAVCLHEALSGRAPYDRVGVSDQIFAFYNRWMPRDGSDPATVIKISQTACQPVAHIQGVLKKGLSPNRAERFATFRAFYEALESVKVRMIANGPVQYELLHVIGQGGFGLVYKARRVSDGRLVAIKYLLRPEYASRFIREAKLIQKFSDSRMVQFIDFFKVEQQEDGGEQYFLVMAFLAGMPGSSLSDRLRKTKQGLPFDEVMTGFIRFAEGLALLHRAEVCHRDIKPSNLYLPEGRAGEACLMDLGVARDAKGSLTFGNVPGTLDFMPPEVAFGESRGDAGMDLYALGLCLYEALTANPALPRLPSGDSAVKSFITRARENLRPALDHPLVAGNAPLRSLLARMTEPDVARREHNARSVAEELTDLLTQTAAPQKDRVEAGPDITIPFPPDVQDTVGGVSTPSDPKGGKSPPPQPDDGQDAGQDSGLVDIIGATAGEDSRHPKAPPTQSKLAAKASQEYERPQEEEMPTRVAPEDVVKALASEKKRTLPVQEPADEGKTGWVPVEELLAAQPKAQRTQSQPPAKASQVNERLQEEEMPTRAAQEDVVKALALEKKSPLPVQEPADEGKTGWVPVEELLAAPLKPVAPAPKPAPKISTAAPIHVPAPVPDITQPAPKPRPKVAVDWSKVSLLAATLMLVAVGGLAVAGALYEWPKIQQKKTREHAETCLKSALSAYAGNEMESLTSGQASYRKWEELADKIGPYDTQAADRKRLKDGQADCLKRVNDTLVAQAVSEYHKGQLQSGDDKAKAWRTWLASVGGSPDQASEESIRTASATCTTNKSAIKNREDALKELVAATERARGLTASKVVADINMSLALLDAALARAQSSGVAEVSDARQVRESLAKRVTLLESPVRVTLGENAAKAAVTWSYDQKKPDPWPAFPADGLSVKPETNLTVRFERVDYEVQEQTCAITAESEKKIRLTVPDTWKESNALRELVELNKEVGGHDWVSAERRVSNNKRLKFNDAENDSVWQRRVAEVKKHSDAVIAVEQKVTDVVGQLNACKQALAARNSLELLEKMPLIDPAVKTEARVFAARKELASVVSNWVATVACAEEPLDTRAVRLAQALSAVKGQSALLGESLSKRLVDTITNEQTYFVLVVTNPSELAMTLLVNGEKRSIAARGSSRPERVPVKGGTVALDADASVAGYAAQHRKVDLLPGGGQAVVFEPFTPLPVPLQISGVDKLKPRARLSLTSKERGSTAFLESFETNLQPGEYTLVCDRNDYASITKPVLVKLGSPASVIDVLETEWQPSKQLAEMQKAKKSWDNGQFVDAATRFPVAWMPSDEEHRKLKKDLQDSIVPYFAKQAGIYVKAMREWHIETNRWEYQVADLTTGQTRGKMKKEQMPKKPVKPFADDLWVVQAFDTELAAGWRADGVSLEDGLQEGVTQSKNAHEKYTCAIEVYNNALEQDKVSGEKNAVFYPNDVIEAMENAVDAKYAPNAYDVRLVSNCLEQCEICWNNRAKIVYATTADKEANKKNDEMARQKYKRAVDKIIEASRR